MGERGDLKIFLLIFCYHYITPQDSSITYICLSRSHTNIHKQARPGKSKERISHARIPYKLLSGYPYTNNKSVTLTFETYSISMAGTLKLKSSEEDVEGL